MTGPIIPEVYGPTPYSERQALPLENYRHQLEEILAGGSMPTESIKGLMQATPEQTAACKIAATFFATPDGLQLLEFLADNSVRRPMVLPPIGTDPAQAYCHVQRRAGQDDMFFFLLKLVAVGREEQPVNREGAQL